MSQSQPPVSEFHAAGGVSSERHGELSVIQDVQRKRRDTWKLSADIEQRRRKLQSVCDEIDRLNEHYESVKEEYQGYDPFLKDEEAKQAARTAETERQSTVRQREELQRLKTDKTQLMERHQRLKLELEGLGEFTDMMSRLPKFTNFKDVDALTEYMESLIHFKDELVEKEQEAQEQVDRMKKERAAVTKQHHLLQMQRNNELALMRTELEDTQAEAVLLEKQWLHVQETAAKKTLQLGQIKISTFNLAQMIRLGLKEEEEGEGGEEGQGGAGGGGGEEDVWADKTESQLDRIMTFVEDYSDSVKRYQITIGPLDAEFNLGQQDNKKKQRGATRSKKKQ